LEVKEQQFSAELSSSFSKRADTDTKILIWVQTQLPRSSSFSKNADADTKSLIWVQTQLPKYMYDTKRVVEVLALLSSFCWSC
jgi:hypothetical protein